MMTKKEQRLLVLVGTITNSHSSEDILKHDFVVRKFFPMLIWTKKLRN